MTPTQLWVNPGPFPHRLCWELGEPDESVLFVLRCIKCRRDFGFQGWSWTPGSQGPSLREVIHRLRQKEREYGPKGDEMCPGAP